VRAGEVIRPEHHNLIVDALWAVRDALRAVAVMGQLCPAAGLTFGYGYLPWPEPPWAPELARVGDAYGIPEMEMWSETGLPAAWAPSLARAGDAYGTPEMETWPAGASPATELAVTAGAQA
jgi:hypothetical protein